ncbi:MAG: 23S rRNA (uracil(1939)-C(5))-methyltransferase RlmD [Betaproteobacteria bacterium]|nr:MAG: 23S rRNA (uracil(1939)-C(5))-methyltransferase RlmD [Betaproteobacteria bacterium]
MSVLIESLDREGRGIARVEGKAIFIDGGLPGERVSYVTYKKKPNYEMASATAIDKPSGARVVPPCPHFGICGGCSMQHLEPRSQVAVKQRVLEDNLWHIGKVRPEVVLTPIYGQTWGYRHRARMSVRMVLKKGGALVGFHERKSSFVADMTSCEVLPRSISDLIVPLRTLIAGLSLPTRQPQNEIAVGEAVTELVLRILDPLSPLDEELLRNFATRHGIQFWLQTKGPDTAVPFFPQDAPPLYYSLPEFGVQIRFRPTDFTQVNHQVNRILVRRAMALLDPRPGERIADLFCGMGNFSLPIASRGAEVLGVEGNAELVRRAEGNARENGLDGRARFQVANLFDAVNCAVFGGNDNGANAGGRGAFDKLLIDPPRDGAVELVKALGESGPGRIVYVSCDPATLARDAEVLVHVKGYRLSAAGVINMFPHTSHVESMALFEK